MLFDLLDEGTDHVTRRTYMRSPTRKDRFHLSYFVLDLTLVDSKTKLDLTYNVSIDLTKKLDPRPRSSQTAKLII